MSNLLKTTLATALFAGLCNTASALELYAPIDAEVSVFSSLWDRPDFNQEVANPSNTETFNADTFNNAPNRTPMKFGIARLDQGRLIALPYGEEEDWLFLDKRSAARFEPISLSGYLKNVPEIPMYGHDTDNKIDEIRLTAQDQNLDYVIIYGVDKSKRNAPIAEARMIDIYTGAELGKVTAEQDEIEFNIGVLADRVGEMVSLYST